MAVKPENRTETGKFKKGVSGNPGGRPKKPVEIEEYARRAPAELKAIAENPDTPVKVRSDIWKFFYEAQYGKAPQAIDVEGKMENLGTQVVKFEGVLDEWSR